MGADKGTRHRSGPAGTPPTFHLFPATGWRSIMPNVHGMHRLTGQSFARAVEPRCFWSRISAAACTLTMASAIWFPLFADAGDAEDWVDPNGVQGTLLIAGGRT